MITRHAHYHKGFTLVDVIVGLALFIVIISMFFHWLISSQQLSGRLLEQYEATNYARSAIEYVEHTRNTATLSRTKMTDYIPQFPTSTLSSCFIFSGTIGTLSITPLPNCNHFDNPLKEPTSKIDTTPYHRIFKISLHKNLINKLPPTHSTIDISSTSRDESIFTVEVHVEWNSKNGSHKASLEKVFTLWPTLP